MIRTVNTYIKDIVDFVVILSQLFAVITILTGMLKSLWIFFKDIIFGAKSMKSIEESRLELGHAFTLGLGFLIGASILKTTITPTWDDIGKLIVIIGIRTVLNHFLNKEIEKHKAEKEINE